MKLLPQLLVVAFSLLAAGGAQARPAVCSAAPVVACSVAAPDAWSDYYAARTAWELDCARIQAEYDVQSAAYLQAAAQFAVDSAAYAAAVAAAAGYPAALDDARALVVATFVDAMPAQEPLLFSVGWAGPWGYASLLSGWLNGAADVALPPSIAGPLVVIHDRLVKASLSVVEWDAHAATVRALEQLRLHPPIVPPEPVAPVPPAPPVFPPAPVPPSVQPATIVADPASFTILATGVRKASSNPLLDVWIAAKAGDVVTLAAGDYRRADFKQSSRPEGSPPVTFRGDRVARARVTPVPVVGGSDTLQLAQGACDTVFENLDFLAASRAGLKFTDSKRPDGTWWGTGQNHTFRNCRVLGGWDPTGSGIATDTLWGFHAYMGGNVLFEDCTFQGICKEHVGCYGHNNQGDYVFRRCLFKWCGRTASQFMARTSEGPIAKGNITFEDCTAIDTCLEDGGGGSAFTFRGGAPNTVVTLTRCVVRLGCDPALKAPFNKNVTGAVLVDSGQYAYPGGTKEMHLIGCDFEVGTVYPGVSNARRPNVSVSDCGLLEVRDCRIVQGPGAHAIALEIHGSVPQVKFAGVNTIVGAVVYRGVTYPTFAAFQAANPTLFSRADHQQRFRLHSDFDRELLLAA